MRRLGLHARCLQSGRCVDEQRDATGEAAATLLVAYPGPGPRGGLVRERRKAEHGYWDDKATPEIEETDQYLQGGKHRPPRLYRFTGRPGLDPDNRSTV